MTADSHHRVFVRNADGTRIALHASYAELPRTGVAVLAHGTFSNHRVCRGLAAHLATRGWDCWIIDFQGHGDSDQPLEEPDFETLCLLDARAAIDHLRGLYPGEALVWIGHSGGGLAILMLLARYPMYRDAVSRVVTLASQATDAARVPRHRLAIRAAAVATHVCRMAPGKWFGLGPQNEFAAVMQQWYGWSLTGRWCGADGFDYEVALADVRAPCLMLAATADTFIAPVSGCRRLYEKLGAIDKQLLVCGVDTGFLEDYSHARIISSRNASRDIWPTITRWLSAP